ncbi:MAG: outer membrane protein transport protein [Bacteroides sp.]|nr:outer membrane protein transport protein [Bacteroides sp.]
MNKRMTLWSLAALMTCGAGAQTIYDAAALSDRDLNGTARFVGMGGAMSALGGDISTMSTNPAGTAIYRSGDVAVSFGLSNFGTESKYDGYKANSDKLRGDWNSAGVVIPTKIGNQTSLRYVNFGFNYQRVKSFYRNMTMEGHLGAYSQTFQMANQADGITNWPNDPYLSNDIGWLSALGFNGYLITDLVAESDLDGRNLQPFRLNGQEVTNRNGEKMYLTNGEYYGMYTDGYGTFRSTERGGIDEFDFNLSFNVNDRAYFGFTIGAYAVNYNKYSFYDEDYGDGQGYCLETWSKINGAGFDLKFGTILRPFESSPLRIGLAIHTPTFYSLDYKTNALLQSDVLNDLSVPNEVNTPSGEIGLYTEDTYDILGGDMVRKFQLHSPWTYNLSLGYTVGRELALGVEYEYKDYSGVKFRDEEGYSDTFAYENSTTEMLKGVSTFRIGAEYKLAPEFSLRAGYNYRSAAFKEDAFKDLPINSIQTDTDFANAESLSNYTLGIGYRTSSFYVDLAYKYTTQEAKFYPFDMFDGERLVQATQVKNARSQMMVTLGLKF